MLQVEDNVDIAGFMDDMKNVILGALPVSFVIGIVLVAIGNTLSTTKRGRDGFAALAALITLLLFGFFSVVVITG